MTDNGDKVAGGWGIRLNLPYKKCVNKNVIKPKIILGVNDALILLYNYCPIWLNLFLFFNAYFPFNIRSQDSNPQPLGEESSPLSTRPWLLAIIVYFPLGFFSCFILSRPPMYIYNNNYLNSSSILFCFPEGSKRTTRPKSWRSFRLSCPTSSRSCPSTSGSSWTQYSARASTTRTHSQFSCSHFIRNIFLDYLIRSSNLTLTIQISCLGWYEVVWDPQKFFKLRNKNEIVILFRWFGSFFSGNDTNESKKNLLRQKWTFRYY